MEIGDINIYIYRCKKCSKPYHTTLHKNTPSNAINPVSASPDISQQDAAAVNTVGPQFALQPTLQMTSQVLLQAPSSNLHLHLGCSAVAVEKDSSEYIDIWCTRF